MSVFDARDYLSPTSRLALRGYGKAFPAVMVAVHQLIYSSAATVRFSENEIATLLLRARAKNGRLGVSGLLLHDSGSFLQVLEGDAEVVNALFATIAVDKRHSRLVQLLKRDVDQRRFADWKMGFVSVSALTQTIPGYSDYLQHRGESGKAADAAERVLSAFRYGRFRSVIT